MGKKKSEFFFENMSLGSWSISNTLNRKYFYFVGNVLVQIRHVFLTDYFLVLSLLKVRSVEGILELKKKEIIQIKKAS